MATILQAVTSTDNVLNADTNMGVVEPHTCFGYVVKVDSELMYVYRTDSTGKQLIVGRGVMGTTKATHAAGATITVHSAVVSVLTKTSALADADYPVAPPIGTFGFDTTAKKLYLKGVGGTWVASVALS